MRDQRDPELLVAAAQAARMPGERLRDALDRVAETDVPDWGTVRAVEARVRLNGRLGRVAPPER